MSCSPYHDRCSYDPPRFTPTTEIDPGDFARHNADWRGQSGLIKTMVSDRVRILDKLYFDTAKNLGIPLLEDPYGGNVGFCDTFRALVRQVGR